MATEVSLKERVLSEFRRYGGWWKIGRMAEWLGVDSTDLQPIWDELEAEGLLERKATGTAGRRKVVVDGS